MVKYMVYNMIITIDYMVSWKSRLALPASAAEPQRHQAAAWRVLAVAGEQVDLDKVGSWDCWSLATGYPLVICYNLLLKMAQSK